MDACTTRPGGRTGEAGKGTPRLLLAGFDGPLALLLRLRGPSRSIWTPVAGGAAPPAGRGPAAGHAETPLGERADWLVMAAWLLLLRSPVAAAGRTPDSRTPPNWRTGRARSAHPAGGAGAGALAGRRPQLGREVFARGQPEMVGTALDVQHAVDVIEFLWASMALFDDGAAMPDTSRCIVRPGSRSAHCRDARARILRLLDEIPDGTPLGRFLPVLEAQAETATPVPLSLRRRSAVASTLIAGLELAREGVVTLHQPAPFAPIMLCARTTVACDQLGEAVA